MLMKKYVIRVNSKKFCVWINFFQKTRQYTVTERVTDLLYEYHDDVLEPVTCGLLQVLSVIE